MSDRRPTALPLVYYSYTGVTKALAPFLHRNADKKLKAAGLPRKRRMERRGVASAQRPLGPLIWMHAVSVGELQSVIGLVETLLNRDNRLTVLVTTTTPSAAEIAKKRLHARAIHQFAPLDTGPATESFLSHWKPDLAVFVESEIWPRQIVSLERRAIPLALINARLSESSVKTWRRLPRLAAALLSRFNLVLCQSEKTKTALQGLCDLKNHIHTTGDLKKSAAPLPADEIALGHLRRKTAARNLWLAASTHPGEDEMLIEAHKIVLQSDPAALLVLMPRHPERRELLAALIARHGMTYARRSQAALPEAEDQIYLADTLGETGLFFRLCPTVFVAGSFVAVGGHNPYEPAHFDSAILHGPLFANFQTAYEDMDEKGAAKLCKDHEALAQDILRLKEIKAAQAMHRAAADYVAGAEALPQEIADRLLALMR